MKNIIFALLSVFLFGCDKGANVNTLNGKSFTISSYRIEAEVDLNNDGVFSNELLFEDDLDCISRERLVFTETEVNPIFNYVLDVSVQNANTNPEQVIGCAIIDYFRSASYRINDNMLTLSFDDQIQATGILNENIITFNIDDSFFIDQYISEDGIVTEYNRGITLVNTLD